MSFRTTSTKIYMDIIDTTAKEDATFTVSSQSFADENNLNEDNSSFIDDYMSLELNYSKLDGTMKEFPYNSSNYKFGYYSSVMSLSDCTFTSNPTITINFDSNHTSKGITLYFGGNNIPKLFSVRYYSSSNTEIYADTYIPDENIYYCKTESTTSNYRKIIIEFISTVYPYNYIKVNNIDFGVTYIWDENILNAEIFEETDILSDKLSIDTFSFTVYSDNEDMNILNPKSIYYSLQEKQKVKVYEYINTYDNNNNHLSTDEYFMGSFYVKNFESINQNQLSIECQDIMGIINDYKFYGSDNYQHISAYSIISDIIDSTGITNYEIDNNLNNIYMFGYIPPTTCREALHQVVFACGAVVSSSRSDNLNIYIPSYSVSKTISEENHLDNDIIKKGKYVSEINIKKGLLILDNKSELNSSTGEMEIQYMSLFNGTLDVGTHTIYLNSPVWLVGDGSGISEPYIDPSSTASVTIDDVKLFKIIITVTSAGTVSILGRNQEYYINNILSKKYSETLITYDNSIYIDNNYFMNDTSSELANNLCDKLITYYNKPDYAECDIIIDTEKSGDWIYIKNQYGSYCKCNILNQKIDLTGGFIAHSKLVFYEEIGKYIDLQYCGNTSNTSVINIFSGENIGLL